MCSTKIAENMENMENNPFNTVIIHLNYNFPLLDLVVSKMIALESNIIILLNRLVGNLQKRLLFWISADLVVHLPNP